MTSPFPFVQHVATTNQGLFREGFLAWLAIPANARVWEEFERMANALWDKGTRHYSARTIGETMRYHTDLADSSPTVKLNDHTWPDLARLYMAVHPEREGFFELRTRRVAA